MGFLWCFRFVNMLFDKFDNTVFPIKPGVDISVQVGFGYPRPPVASRPTLRRVIPVRERSLTLLEEDYAFLGVTTNSGLTDGVRHQFSSSSEEEKSRPRGLGV